jgi:hypothetical protein
VDHLFPPFERPPRLVAPVPDRRRSAKERLGPDVENAWRIAVDAPGLHALGDVVRIDELCVSEERMSRPIDPHHPRIRRTHFGPIRGRRVAKGIPNPKATTAA